MSRPLCLIAACAALLLVSAAPAAAAGTPLKQGSRGAAVEVLQKALGLRADGAFGAGTRRAVVRFQRRHRLKADGVARPSVLRKLGIADDVARVAGERSGPTGSGGAAAGEVPEAERDARAVLARIAQCESGGDPKAVSRDGRYRGKYQFLRSTWESLGGTGDPAAAPEAEQDRLALALYEREGIGPWPHCGRQATRG